MSEKSSATFVTTSSSGFPKHWRTSATENYVYIERVGNCQILLDPELSTIQSAIETLSNRIGASGKLAMDNPTSMFVMNAPEVRGVKNKVCLLSITFRNSMLYLHAHVPKTNDAAMNYAQVESLQKGFDPIQDVRNRDAARKDSFFELVKQWAVDFGMEARLWGTSIC